MTSQPMRGGMVIQNHDSDHAAQELRNRIAQQWQSLTHPEPPMLPADLEQLAREVRRGRNVP